MLVLAFCGIAGFILARLARLPAAAILGPMLFSAAFHMTGVTDAKPPVELINAAQVVVGTTIGCRFAGVKLALVARSIVASIGSTIILASTGDRKSVGSGKSVSVRVDLGGRRILKN